MSATDFPNLSTPRKGCHLFLLAVLVLASAGLRFNRISAPIGGFHGFNEANYVLIAQNYANGSLLAPTPDGKYIFLETPPLYSYLIYAVDRVFASPIVVARSISAVASLAALLLVYALGRLFFSPWVGLLAAAFYGLAPINTVLGHNAQTDSLYLALLLLAQWLYFRSLVSNSPGGLIPAGLSLGAACFTKAFAWISLPFWFASETWRARGFHWLKVRQIWIAGLIGAIIVLPFYAYQAITRFGQLFHDMIGGAVTMTASAPLANIDGLLAEAWWGYGPPLALLFAVGLIWGGFQKEWPRRFLFLQSVGYLIFVIFVHKHSYYLASVTPFLSLLAAAALVRLRPRGLAVALGAGTVVALALLSLLLLTQVKYGFDEFEQLNKLYHRVYRGQGTILVREDFVSSFLRELEYYIGPERVINLDYQEMDANHRLKLSPSSDRLLIYFVSSPSGYSDHLISRKRYALVLFGIEIKEDHPNIHYFAMGHFSFDKKHPWTTFGVLQTQDQPIIAVTRVPKTAEVFLEGQKIVIKSRF